MFVSNGVAGRTMLLFVAFCFWIYVTSAAATGMSPSLLRRNTIANGIDLRVMPIGDSITRGSGDANNGGYRKSVYEKLSTLSNRIEFVGSLSEGNFPQNRHEGHRGEQITEIEHFSRAVGMSSRPNIALLHAGTNDMDRNYRLSEAPARLEKLIRTIITYSPQVTVLVCQIIPSRSASTMAAINEFNLKIPGLVERLEREGLKVALVDMRLLNTGDDLVDWVHPSRLGYQKMADRFYDAIIAADSKGWITRPQDPGPNVPQVCRNLLNAWHAPVTIAQGPSIAQGDGAWTERWINRGVVAKGNCPRSRLHFMDLNGDGIMDYACVDEDTGAVNVNIGRVSADGVKEDLWGPREKIAMGRPGRKGSGVKFADLNGDGRSDYVYLDKDTGTISAWINDGPGAADGGYRWRSLGRIASRADATSDNLHFADFTGDGRDDFLLINQQNGEVRGWVNRGDKKLDDFPSFHAVGVIATGRSHETGVDKVIMGDFTGKGRVDYLLVKAGGRTTGFINRLRPGSVIPAWGPETTVAGGPTGARQAMVRLADLNGDGVVDYLLIDEESGEVRMWENRGSGGKFQPGEGTLFADLDGDGTQDYIWVNAVGNAYGYINIGKGTDSWQNKGLLVQPGSSWNRPHNVRFAVLTTSGRADYIAIEEGTGRAQWWKNLGSGGGGGGGFNFEWAGQAHHGVWQDIAEKSGFGWRFKTQNIRFADLDGDGLDDLIYISDFGATLWYRNRGVEPPSFEPYKTVADGPGITAMDVQFADVDGDGRLDYIVTSQLTGAAHVWLSKGLNPGGTRIDWRPPARLAGGPDGVVGRDVRLVEVSGDRRADYVAINPENGAARMWRSRCVPATTPDGSEIGDDDEFPTPQWAVVPKLHKSCEPFKDILWKAWREAGLIAKAQYKWTRFNKHQRAMDMYIGKTSGQIPWIGIDHIWGNIRKHYAVHYGGEGSPAFVYPHWFCDVNAMPAKTWLGDEEDIERQKRDACLFYSSKRAGTAARTWNFTGAFSDEYYTLFCPFWLGQQATAPYWYTLEEYTSEGDGFAVIREEIDGWKAVRALTMHHEVNHWRYVSWPECKGNEEYRPEAIASHAQIRGNNQSRGYEFAIRNAHSWSLAALSSYMMDHWNMNNPPRPRKPVPDEPPEFRRWVNEPPADGDDVTWWSVFEEEADESWFDADKVNPTEFTRLSKYGEIAPDRMFECSAGKYHDEQQCELLCGGKKCTRESDGTFNCASCTPDAPICQSGVHADFDDCFSKCRGGLCTESAGQNGVRCTC